MLENTLGTWETRWEPWVDLMGTQEKKNSPYSPKRKKFEPLLCMLGIHWLPRISMPTCVLYQFWPRQMAGAQTLGTSP
jgi:hypothetical protein